MSAADSKRTEHEEQAFPFPLFMDGGCLVSEIARSTRTCTNRERGPFYLPAQSRAFGAKVIRAWFRDHDDARELRKARSLVYTLRRMARENTIGWAVFSANNAHLLRVRRKHAARYSRKQRVAYRRVFVAREALVLVFPLPETCFDSRRLTVGKNYAFYEIFTALVD